MKRLPETAPPARDPARTRRAAISGAVHAFVFSGLSIGAMNLTSPLRSPQLFAGILLFAGLLFAAHLARIFERPAGRDALVAGVLRGAAVGALVVGALTSIVADGPGWPATPYAIAGALVAAGALRARKALLDAAERAGPAPPGRWVCGKEAEALAILLVALALLGGTGYFLLNAFAGLAPDLRRALPAFAIAYGLYVVRVLLAFAARDSDAAGEGFVPWLKANALRNAIFVALLAGYFAFRDGLAGAVPHYPLWEFGFGMMLFGAVLARLRHRLKRRVVETPVASPARVHERRAVLLADPEYEGLARPVSLFVERGEAGPEYFDALRRFSLIESDGEAARVLEPLKTFHQPRPLPPLPLAAAFASGSLVSAGWAVASAALLVGAFGAPSKDVLPLAVVVFGLFQYRLQDAARQRDRPWVALAAAAAGTAIALAGAVAFLQAAGAPLASLSPLLRNGLLAFAGALVVLPAIASWRLHRRLKKGGDGGRGVPELPSAALERDAAKARRRVGVALAAGFALFFILSPLLGTLAEMGTIPKGLLDAYRSVLPAVGSLFAGLAAGGGLDAAILYRERPRVAAREATRRGERLALHRELMRRIAET